MNQITKKGLPTEQLDLPHYAIAQEESYLLDETVIETVLAAVRKLPEKDTTSCPICHVSRTLLSRDCG